jgi:transcriptional regulator with XRE-family HTH domain
MTTGAQLRAARRAADLTLAEIARLGGVSAGHLSRVEMGEREVTPATVVLTNVRSPRRPAPRRPLRWTT